MTMTHGQESGIRISNLVPETGSLPENRYQFLVPETNTFDENSTKIDAIAVACFISATNHLMTKSDKYLNNFFKNIIFKSYL